MWGLWGAAVRSDMLLLWSALNSLVHGWTNRQFWSGQGFWCTESEHECSWWTHWHTPEWWTQSRWCDYDDAHLLREAQCWCYFVFFTISDSPGKVFESGWLIGLFYLSKLFNCNALRLIFFFLTGDDRNIVEVFVAGRKVIPFTETNKLAVL